MLKQKVAIITGTGLMLFIAGFNPAKANSEEETYSPPVNNPAYAEASSFAEASEDRSAGRRVRMSIDFDWKFFKEDISGAEKVTFNDSDWESVNIPHDWSIEGPFAKNNPSGRGEGYLPGGIGWYRKYFSLPENYQTKKVFVEFDGVYMCSEVWINGNYLGSHPNGYTSFCYDLTPYLNYVPSPLSSPPRGEGRGEGVNKNVLAVRVDNANQPNSRWYSGSGIYRHVWLLSTDKLHVAHWGTFVTTPEVSEKSATINLKTRIKNEYPGTKKCNLITTLINSAGKVMKEIEETRELKGNDEYEFGQNIKIENPNLWSPDNPYLYKIYSTIKDGEEVVDNYETALGIRTFYFDPDQGFFLNGENIKIKGTCNHHDGGCLGAACPDALWERRVQLLKEMGCNAFRTSHNPPAPELLDYCDRYGLLVMDEAFDEWKKGKTKYGYHKYFEEWALKDLKSIIHRDRNHPSIILWSVGNEIPEQGSSKGVEILEKLVEIVRAEDPTRPVTAACNMPGPNKVGFADCLDVVGYNYGEKWYDSDHLRYPDRKMIGSETASALETRGVYHLPAETLIYRTPDKYCSSYDNCWVPWGASAREAWRAAKERDFIAGVFIWTGFDYIGEPTPYGWPARSSYFGVIDLCGFPKDGFYFYQSQWSAKPMIHILPHWNWPGEEGEIIPVWCYTNCDRAELFLNDESLGEQTVSPEDLYISWDVPYVTGTLRVLGKKEGEIVCRQEIHTAGEASKILLSPDKNTIVADGRDISLIKVSILDSKGNLVPNADNSITFDIQGEGKLIGMGNGDELSTEDFKSNQREAFYGLCLAVVQSIGQPGQIRITATSPGLASGSVIINSIK